MATKLPYKPELMSNTTFVEANTKNISAKSQPYVPYGF